MFLVDSRRRLCGYDQLLFHCWTATVYAAFRCYYAPQQTVESPQHEEVAPLDPAVRQLQNRGKSAWNWILSVLPYVIHPDQSCAISGRNPSENCRMDVVMDANKNNIGGAVLSLDQEKVFDRVEWSYQQSVLQATLYLKNGLEGQNC